MKQIKLDKTERLYKVYDENGKVIDYSSSLSQLRKKGYSEKEYPYMAESPS